MKKKLSIIVPVYNEKENIMLLYDAVMAVINGLKDRYEYEFVFTDNHSNDGSAQVLEALAARDTNVRVYRFSKNFGFQRSVYAGFLQARGDAAVQIDCDLQDPPALIKDFLSKWEEGYSVVYGVRQERKESWWLHLFRKIFYRTINLLSEDELPVDVGDFRLVDRRILNELAKIEDAQPYVRGTIATMGFAQCGISYAREERKKGSSKFSFRSLMALALDGIINHSIIPLRLATYTGIAVSLVTFALLSVYVLGKIFYGQDWPAGFATTTALILLTLSLNSLFLGIIGEYLGRIYKQVKKRPLIIIERSFND